MDQIIFVCGFSPLNLRSFRHGENLFNRCCVQTRGAAAPVPRGRGRAPPRGAAGAGPPPSEPRRQVEGHRRDVKHFKNKLHINQFSVTYFVSIKKVS